MSNYAERARIFQFCDVIYSMRKELSYSFNTILCLYRERPQYWRDLIAVIYYLLSRSREHTVSARFILNYFVPRSYLFWRNLDWCAMFIRKHLSVIIPPDVMPVATLIYNRWCLWSLNLKSDLHSQ
jgi:hypothetical protein